MGLFAQVLAVLLPMHVRAVVLEGSTGPGSRYELRVPDAGWNQQLVVYLHGITNPQEPVALPSDALYVAVRDGLLARGFAVAASSYSWAGWDVRDGAQRSHQLSGLFTARVARPERVFLVGESMGSLIGLELVERFPNRYAGALLTCGVLAGTRVEFEYVTGLRNLFDVFYPGKLPGDAVSMPAPVCDAQQVGALVVPPVLADPSGAFLIATMAQARLPFRDPTELVLSLALPLGWQLCSASYLADAAHGTVYDNTTTVYGPMPGFVPPPPGAALYDWVNASVARFAADPQALYWQDHWYAPTGALRVPVLTLHTTRDPGVPEWLHAPALRALAEQAGDGANLVQRTVDRYGHCAFEPSELLESFDALVGWSAGGPRPAAGDVTAR